MGTGRYVIVAVGGCHPFGGIVGPDRGLPTEDPAFADEPFGCELTTELGADENPSWPDDLVFDFARVECPAVFDDDVDPFFAEPFPEFDECPVECVCGWQGFPQGVVAPALPAPKKLAATMRPTIKNAKNKPDATVWKRRLTRGCLAMSGSMRRNNTSTVDSLRSVMPGPA